MAIKLIPVKCPECGASLNAEEGRQQMFCQYCGAKIILSNDNEYIQHYINEADVRRAETERLIRLKELEMLEKEKETEEKNKRNKIIIVLSILGVAVVFFILAFAVDAIFAAAGLLTMDAAMFAALFAFANKKK